MEELKTKIEVFRECNNCYKVSNYPAEWLEEITTKQKVVFTEYSTKAERAPLVTAIKKEYSDRFDDEGREVKIPFEGSFYTLVEAKAKLVEAEVAREEEYQRLEEEYKATQYQRDRAPLYPTLTEQADMAYWDRKNGTTTLDDAIDAVKLQNPKGVTNE